MQHVRTDCLVSDLIVAESYTCGLDGAYKPAEHPRSDISNGGNITYLRPHPLRSALRLLTHCTFLQHALLPTNRN